MPPTEPANSEWTALPTDEWIEQVEDPPFVVPDFPDELKRQHQGGFTYVLCSNGDLHQYTAGGEWPVSDGVRRIVLHEWGIEDTWRT